MRPLVFLLTLAVTFAVGVCPCALAWTLTSAAKMPPATASVVRGHCSACTGDDSSKPSSSHREADASSCATVISGDLPAAPTAPPVLLALPEVIARVADVLNTSRPASVRVEHRAVGPSPPRTLFDLACSLTI